MLRSKYANTEGKYGLSKVEKTVDFSRKQTNLLLYV
jgi:hypothetical protein